MDSNQPEQHHVLPMPIDTSAEIAFNLIQEEVLSENQASSQESVLSVSAAEAAIDEHMASMMKAESKTSPIIAATGFDNASGVAQIGNVYTELVEDNMKMQ